MWVSGSLTRDQFNSLIAHGGYPKLADYLHAAHPGTKFITVGQKNYAVYSSNGPTGDISVTFSSRNFNCDGDGDNWRGPTGLNVPDYISAPVCGRYYVDFGSLSTGRRRRRRPGCTRSTATASRRLRPGAPRR